MAIITVAGSAPAPTSTRAPCSSITTVLDAADGSARRTTRASLTPLPSDSVDAACRRKWLDHHNKLRADSECRSAYCSEVSPLRRHAFTRSAHSAARAMPTNVHRQLKRGYTGA
jgi:hypothetical protein